VTRARASLFASALLVCAAVAGGCSLPGRTTGPIEVTATFDDVGDLVENHSVQVADVRVGSVTGIELTPDFKAKVTMSIKDVHLPADAVAELRQTSLLGEKFIELRPCDPSPAHQDKGCQNGGGGTLQSNTDIPPDRTKQAPELEFVAEQATQLLGGVVSNDVAALVQTGSAGFGGRAEELRGLLDDLSTISATLADQTTNLQTIIDGLDQATTTIAADNPALDQLLVNLADTTTLLANNRDQAVQTLQSLTRFVQTQDQLVFDPYLQQVDRQIKELDGILAVLAQGRGEVSTLLDWLNSFMQQVPKGVPGEFAQVYGWFVQCGTPGSTC
jgi:phospholipid/cholesterol/gamma-HCH transport system substrate-binding protein